MLSYQIKILFFNSPHFEYRAKKKMSFSHVKLSNISNRIILNADVNINKKYFDNFLDFITIGF